MPLFDGNFTASSPTIPPLAPIPAAHSAAGRNHAPHIVFSGSPAGTVEFALVCHDPDAPLPHGFTHWTAYCIPGDTTSLDLSAPGVREGPNGIDGRGWTRPEPPAGHGLHRCYFWLYALDRRVNGEPTRERFLDEYADAVIEQAPLVGTFER